MVQLITEKDLVCCKDEYRDPKTKQVTFIRVACAAIQLGNSG